MVLTGATACIGVLIVFGAFWCIGRLTPGCRFWECPLIGWALVYLLSVIAALAGVRSLDCVVVATAVLAVVSLVWRRPQLSRHTLFPYLAALPFLALSVLTPPVFSDSYSHWLPNASYLYQLGHFPETPLGNFISLHPTYPTALPLVIYMVSVVTGRFAELAGNVINAVMVLLAMGCIWQLLRETWPSRDGTLLETPFSRCLIAAITFCIAIPLNPAIEIRYYWSVIADPALGVLVLLTIAECCRYMASQSPHRGEKHSLFLLFALACLVSGLKPNAWLLAPILGTAVGFVGLVHRVPVRRWLPPAIAIVGGALLSAILWKLYLVQHLAIPDQFAVRRLTEWSFELWDELLTAMLQILKTHTLYSALVLATMGLGFASLIRRTLISNPTLRLMAGLVSVAMALHVASLFAAYLGGGFEDWMITTASSFPRYTTHVGYAVCVTGLVVASTVFVPLLSSRLSGISSRVVATACLMGCVALFAFTIVRPTLALQFLAEERAYDRKLALAALKEIEAGARVVAAAPKWTVTYLRYAVWADLKARERPHLVEDLMFFEADDDCQADRVLAGWLANPSIDAVLLVNAREYTRRCAPNSAPNRVWRRLVGRWEVLDLQRHKAG